MPVWAQQAFANNFDGGVGGALSRGMSADAIDHRVDAAIGIDEEAVFVVGAAAAGSLAAAWRRRVFTAISGAPAHW